MTEPRLFDADPAMTTRMLNDLAQLIDAAPPYLDGGHGQTPGWSESLLRRIELSRRLDQFFDSAG
jgi:hypothetical protein